MKLKEYIQIMHSGYFDPSYYLLKNPDVRKADIDPLIHFIKYGWKEGRDPSQEFNTKYYLEINPDVKVAGINPLLHYLKYNPKVGREMQQDPIPLTQRLRSLFCKLYIKNTSRPHIIKRSYHLFQKSLETFLKEGPKGLISKIRVYINKREIHKSNAKRFYVNLYNNIFVNIQDDIESADLEKPQILQKLKDEVIMAFNYSPIQNPLVSIIIPTYNHIDDTIRCLYSIYSANENTLYEIIVADDGSSDETINFIGQCKAIRLIQNYQNQGFLKNCNQAAKEAHGQFLIFLNNDTAVLPNWIDSIIETFLEFPKAGLVGSKLIFPDGRLQEAGGVIWSDGSALNYGKYDDPGKPQYNYLREVDYCSGACIMIRNDLWKSLGGFDELFAPAYYEDTDLSYRVRQAGYSVFYQPLSQVFHIEGATSGTDIESGIKQYQTINRQKFKEKWEDIIKVHKTDGNYNEFSFCSRYSNYSVLFIDACTPTPDQDSGSIDAMNYMKMLREMGCDVVFIPDDNLLDFGQYTKALQKIGIECLYQPYIGSIKKYLRNEGQRFNLVILSRGPVAFKYIDNIRVYAPHAKIIFNTVDLHFLREEREAEINGSKEQLESALNTREKEISVMLKADQTILVSEYEHQIIQDFAPDVKTKVIPIPREIPGRSCGFENRNNILFIGGYNHLPNVNAVFFFVQEIWPLIKKQIPDCKFWIAGSNMPEIIRSLGGDDIVILGHVPDLDTIFTKCKLSIAPLRYGAGIKGKIVTSLSYGVPCVATSIAVEGMGLELGNNILIGDTPEEFSEAVVNLYTSPKLWMDFSESGLELIKRKYSIDKFRSNLKQLINEL